MVMFPNSVFLAVFDLHLDCNKIIFLPLQDMQEVKSKSQEVTVQIQEIKSSLQEMKTDTQEGKNIIQQVMLSNETMNKTLKYMFRFFLL